MTSDWSKNFTDYLKTLAENRAALAALRRGLGKPPGMAMEMFPYIYAIPMPDYAQRPCFIVAALFGSYPEAPAFAGNLGASFRQLAAKTQSDGAQRRFVALLRAEENELPTHLRHAVALLKANKFGISWEALLRDVAAWGHPRRYVQPHWAKSFWVAPSEDEDMTTTPNTENEHDH